MKRNHSSLAGAALALSLLAASPASAQDCTTLPNVVIGSGGSASKPLLASLATALAGLPTPITLAYASPGACFGITPYVDGTGITGSAAYWGADGAEHSCTLPITGLEPDFGMLGTSATLCEGVDVLPDGIGDFAGPVTGWSVLVPNSSSQVSISSEALYFVYGFGAAGGVSPWTVPGQIFGRNATSAAQIALGLGVGVPADRFVCATTGRDCIDVRTNQAMITALATSTTPESAIGFVSSEVADRNRASVRTLAYQHTDQSCGYWPDSTSTAFDKANIRDGHYYLWSAYHFYARVGADGLPSDPDAARLIGFFTGDVPTPDGVSLLDIVIDNGNVPECAMRVWRDEDIGPLYSYLPEAPCGCYYDARATGETSCTECDGDADCSVSGSSGSVCRHGYCEVS